MKAFLVFLAGLSGVLGLVVLSNAQPAPATHDEAVPVIVELYTSEGCSSCPSADELLSSLTASQPIANAHVIPLALHVDYWNRLGWTDRFSSADYSERQRQYAEIFKSNRIYTPQMIVDGRVEFTGSDRAAAEKALEESARHAKQPLTLRAIANSESRITLSVGVGAQDAATSDTAASSKSKLENPSVLYIAITEDNLNTNVQRGENTGKRLAHNGVVRQLIEARKYNAGESPDAVDHPVDIQSEWKRGHLNAVAFLQDKKTGQILAADSVSLADVN